MSDLDLLTAAKTDQEAFGVFYDRHVRSLLAYFYSRTVCAETAADLTAETFASALSEIRSYRQEAPPVGWLFGIARHELSRALRRKRVEARARRRLGIERLGIDDASIERIESLVDLHQLAVSLKDAMNSLSSSEREAIELRVGLELPYREVAVRLRCSEGAARVRVARGLAKLNTLREEEARDGASRSRAAVVR